jgi:uncharacterized surface protein with fasciclin (FAS1) repeats
MTEKSLHKQNRIAIPVALAIALGPLTALTLGSMFADKETIARAEAGERNIDLGDQYRDYTVPSTKGDAADVSVVDVIDGSKPFDRFRDLVEQANMVDVLNGTGPFTLFVSADQAFDDLSSQRRDQLMGDQSDKVNLVSAQVAPGRLSATDLMQMDKIETLDGRTFDVGEGGHLSIGNAEVIKGDLVAGNGIVHVVDGFVP